MTDTSKKQQMVDIIRERKKILQEERAELLDRINALHKQEMGWDDIYDLLEDYGPEQVREEVGKKADAYNDKNPARARAYYEFLGACIRIFGKQ